MRITLCFFMLAMPVTTYAQDNDLAIEIASDKIGVTVGFNGAGIDVFGDRRNKDNDVIIVVEGPNKNITMWQKARVMGAWINRYSVDYKDIPSYYSYAYSGSDEKNALLSASGIGHEGLFKLLNAKSKAKAKVKNVGAFNAALLNKKQKRELYFKEPSRIVFLNEYFFRVHFDIPPSAPTGTYKIHSFLVQNGQVIKKESDVLNVEQVGLNAFVYQAARRHSFLYALICIMIGVFSGWLVSVLKVKP